MIFNYFFNAIIFKNKNEYCVHNITYYINRESILIGKQWKQDVYNMYVYLDNVIVKKKTHLLLRIVRQTVVDGVKK